MQLSLVLAFVAALVTEAELRRREVRRLQKCFNLVTSSRATGSTPLSYTATRAWINRGWCDDADDRWAGGPFVRWCRFVGDTD